MPFKFKVVQNNIVSIEADAIVNSANTSLQKGSGLCQVIYNHAGESYILDYIRANYGSDIKLNPGEAIITPGFNLRAKHIIHTITPKYYIGDIKNNIATFSTCYVSIIKAALDVQDIASIAIPCIGIGHHGWPLKETISISLDTLLWLNLSIDKTIEIIFCCNNEEQYNFYQKELANRNI